jgi:hypothetical protein
MACFLLAAALQAGPPDAATPPRAVSEEELPGWLAAERPVLRSVELLGLEHTKDAMVRRELRVREGAVLDRDLLRETRLRLEETRLFESITWRAYETAPGQAVLDVELDERHGFGNLWNLLGRGVADALRKKVRVRYSNLAGRGVNLVAEHKWERTQPSVFLSAHAVRPFGLPANVEIVARRGRPQYDLEDDGQDLFTLRTRGLEVLARRVVAPGTVVEVGGRLRERRFTVRRPDTPDGVVAGPQWGVEHRVWDTAHQRGAVSLRVFHALGALRGDVRYTRGLLGLSYRACSSGGGQERLPASELAARVNWGRGSAGTPLDDMFAPGTASEAEFPLRAHRQKRDGVLGRAPIGRELTSANLEWRRRFLRLDSFRAAAVLFYDVAHIGRPAQGGARTLQDVGVGLRLQGTLPTIVRLDFAHGLTDGKNALTAGIGHTF